MSRFGHTLDRLACRLFGHRFVTFCDGLKRRCPRCGREDWVFSRPYPRIGETKYHWNTLYDHVDTRPAEQLRRRNGK